MWLRDDLAVGRGDLSDGQWAVLEPLLPVAVAVAVAVAGRPAACRRSLIDGIRWRVRTGAPWRDLPAEYGPWQTVYGLFRRWQRQGVWAAVLSGLQARADAAGLITWEVNVDSTICRDINMRAAPAGMGLARGSPRVGCGRSRSITRWGGRGEGGPPRSIWLVSRVSGPCRYW